NRSVRPLSVHSRSQLPPGGRWFDPSRPGLPPLAMPPVCPDQPMLSELERPGPVPGRWLRPMAFSGSILQHEVTGMAGIRIGRKICSLGACLVLLAGVLLWTATTPSAQPAADDPSALLRQGMAHRSLGLQELAQADAKPAEAAQLRAK